MIGHGPGVATKYQIFTGVSNLAIVYVAALDGFGENWGLRLFASSSKARQIGVLGVDAAATFVGVAILGVMFFYLRRRPTVPSAINPAVAADA
jgi:hypothetical protein